ncbi:hypothetical protein HKX48_001108 [Thoreauomyces humboldtii]|nr:hypothetical protein HKX48_001108 [Thoreauomyces humboldtii]
MHLTSLFTAAVLTLATVASTATIPAATAACPIATSTTPKYSFTLAGDSTVAPGSGWGNDFCSLIKGCAPCLNAAIKGTTTASFRADGGWKTVLDNVRSSKALGQTPLVAMQWGHNDQKPAANITVAQYKANLAQFVVDVQTAGGTPFIVTSLTRRTFDGNGKLNDTLGPWADAAAAVAVAKKINYLQLHTASETYVQAIGEAAAWRLDNAPGDHTHLNPNGATIFGRMVGDLWMKVLVGTKGAIRANATLTYDIAHGKAVF